MKPHPPDDPFFHVTPEKIPVMPAKFDALRIGRIDQDGRRYLGNGCYQLVDHETSETNERREGRP